MLWPLADLVTDEALGVVVDGRDLALYTVEGAVFATDNICAHGNARPSDGFVNGHAIECPLHQGHPRWRAVVQAGDGGDPHLSVKVEGGRVLRRVE